MKLPGKEFNHYPLLFKSVAESNSWEDDRTAILPCCEQREWLPFNPQSCYSVMCSPPAAQWLWTWGIASLSSCTSSSSKLTFLPDLKSDTLCALSPHKKVLNEQVCTDLSLVPVTSDSTYILHFSRYLLELGPGYMFLIASKLAGVTRSWSYTGYLWSSC